MKHLIAVLVFLFLCLAAEAQITQIRVWDGSGWKQGTGVCIAHRTKPPRAVVVTVRHIFDGTDGAYIEIREKKVGLRRARLRALHHSRDLAIIEVPECEMTEYQISREIPEGIDVVVCGYGPCYNKQNDDGCFRGKIVNGGIWGNSDFHPIGGDSGGPVIAKRDDGVPCVMGVVTGYTSDRPITPYRNRRDISQGSVLTNFVDSEEIYRFVKTQYGGCPTCPAWVVPEVRQPMIGIGIPVGPPKVVGVTPYRPPGYPIQNLPQPPSEAVEGPPGPEGPPGQPGKDGRSVDQKKIENLLVQWLDEHKDDLKGPKGDQGEPSTLDISDLEKRLEVLEKRKQRFLIVDSKTGTVIDDESYTQDEPVVLDIRRLKSTAPSDAE